MAWRVSFFWTQQGDRLGGWSENYWSNLASYDAVVASARILRLALDNCKGVQTYCPRFRVTNTSVFRSGQTTIIAGAAAQTPGSASGDPSPNASDYQGTKVLMRMFFIKNGQRLSTTQWFGGQNDSAIVSGGFYVQGSIGAQGTLFALLGNPNAGWCVNSLVAPTTGGPIASIDPVTGTVTLPAGGTAPAPIAGRLPRIRIQGVRGLLYANRVWNCILPGVATNPISFVLQGWNPTQQQQVPMGQSNNPRFTNQAYALFPIQSVGFIRSSNHRIGRPPGQFGGKPKRRATA